MHIKWKMILANYAMSGVCVWMMLSISYPEADIHCAAIESVRLGDTFTAAIIFILFYIFQ